MRCFIAIPLPEDLRKQLADIQRQLKQFDGDVTWSKPEGIHLTLKFLGEMSKEQIESIKKVMSRVASNHPRFSLESGGTGCFPTIQHPRILWVGLNQGKESVVKLAAELEKELVLLDIPSEARAFNPHLTLGRVKSTNNLGPMMEYFQKRIKPDSHRINASEIHLYESILKPSGAEYRILYTATLSPETH